MFLPSLAYLSLLLPAAQDSGPEIVDVKSTYGYLGAPRPKGGMMPGDVAHVSFGIKNLKADAAGKVSYSIGIVIKNDEGKVIYEQRPFNAVAQNLFGGDTLPAAARIEVPLDIKPGAAHWEVTVEDRAAGKKTKLSGQGKVLAPDFAIVRLGAFADVENKAPISPDGVVGSHRHIAFALAGFARGKKQPDVEVELRILDDKGQPTLAQPLKASLKDAPEDWQFLPMEFAMTYTRPGRFTVELIARDRLAGKTSQVSFPIRVLAAE